LSLSFPFAEVSTVNVDQNHDQTAQNDKSRAEVVAGSTTRIRIDVS
jgi:hypothetical protein